MELATGSWIEPFARAFEEHMGGIVKIDFGEN